MWNFASELIKREHGMLKHPFPIDCYGSMYMAENLETSYVPFRGSPLSIKFYQNGDHFGIFSYDHFLFWHTEKRKELFRTDLDSENFVRHFHFLNNNSKQGGVNIVYGDGNYIKTKSFAPSGAVCATKTISLPEVHYRLSVNIELAVCPNTENQVLCSIGTDIIYQIDFRAGAGVVAQHKHRRGEFYALTHDPIKSEVCVSTDSDSIRILDTRYLKDFIKDFTIEDSRKFRSAYNFDGGEIVSQNQDPNSYRNYHIFNNRNPIKMVRKYLGFGRTWMPHFFGPKSDFLVGVENSNKQLRIEKPNFFKYLEHHIDGEWAPFADLATHPNKLIIVARADDSHKLAFCAPKGTFDLTAEGTADKPKSSNAPNSDNEDTLDDDDNDDDDETSSEEEESEDAVVLRRMWLARFGLSFDSDLDA